MSDTNDDLPTSLRRVQSPSSAKLIRLVEAYDDLQTMLWCCERLVSMLGERTTEQLDVEAVWALALLSYARAFSGTDGKAALTPDDLVDPEGTPEETLRWHKVMLVLRARQADPGKNPRESFTVGLAQDENGAVNAIAVTSVRSPMVDEAAVRKAGAMVFPLCAMLDERIAEQQKTILAEVRDTPATTLEAMDLIEVVPTG